MSEAMALRELATAIDDAGKVRQFFSQYCRSAPALSLSWSEASACVGYSEARAAILVSVAEVWIDLVEAAVWRADERVAAARKKLAEVQK